MKKFAIYTACIGNYDNIVQPEVIDERFDYILFTDDVKEDRIGIWQVRHIDYTNSNQIRIARYAKTHPEELLSDYCATLWLDANVQIFSQYVYDRIYKLYEDGVEIAGVTHPQRNCIFDEAFELMRLQWERDTILFRWCSKIRRECFPQHYGMYETNILYRKNSELMRKFDKLWWKCINENSYRDQMSCSYVLWKLGIDYSYFLPQGENVWNTTKFHYIWHPDNAFKKKKLNYTRNEQIRWRIRHGVFDDENKYKTIYLRLYKYPLAPLMLYIREIIDLLWFIPYRAYKKVSKII